MNYYLGLDNGGTTTKAALFDSKGNEIGKHSVSTASITEKPGFVERDMEEMWDANCEVVRGVMEKCKVSPDDIKGVGICGHGKGLYLWGKDNKPLRNGIISTDNRAYAYSEKWKKDGTEKKAFELSCQHVMACQSVALLAWLKDNEPENYKNIGWVFECKDYVRFRMTGEAKAEITDYSGAHLMNLHTRNYDRELLKLYGIEEVFECLPPLCRATEICGYVTKEAAEKCGLKEGTPVIGGMFDINACAIATGVMDTDKICMIAGTWSINEYIRKAPVLDGKVQMNSLFCMPEYYLIEESSPTSSGNLEWVIRQLLPELKEEVAKNGGSIYDYTNNCLKDVPPEEFVPVFLPFLMASNVHANARGSLVGMSVSHTRKHIIRAVLEGITFCHRYHLEKLLATRDEAPKTIRLAGGMTANPNWVQMFADVMQLPVETAQAGETGALGCAIAAAVAAGEYGSLDEGIKEMTNIAPAVMPRADKKDIYDKKYALYCRLIDSLDGLWDEMQSVVEGR
ncbi:MAG: carbohydrate kinase [Lachnospiraceae bacterium]|nr:carbohydrate kinase [Lachnospiraceae bacterium]